MRNNFLIAIISLLMLSLLGTGCATSSGGKAPANDPSATASFMSTGSDETTSVVSLKRERDFSVGEARSGDR